ncbi:unnamed protein product [Arctogadus glacialis]
MKVDKARARVHPEWKQDRAVADNGDDSCGENLLLAKLLCRVNGSTGLQKAHLLLAWDSETFQPGCHKTTRPTRKSRGNLGRYSDWIVLPVSDNSRERERDIFFTSKRRGKSGLWLGNTKTCQATA